MTSIHKHVHTNSQEKKIFFKSKELTGSFPASLKADIHSFFFFLGLKRDDIPGDQATHPWS